MKPGERNQHRVDDALSALDAVHRTTPAPFFYTRVKARILAAQTRSTHFSDGVRVRMLAGIAGIVVLVLINVFTIVRLTQTGGNPIQGKDNFESFADEYNLSYSLY